jgi:hypothetical protein
MTRAHHSLLRFNKDAQRLESMRTYRIVCKSCRRGYGSALDGLCSKCRGCDAYTARKGRK